MISDIHTNPRDIKFSRIMKENFVKLVITRDMISLIFYEEAPTIGVVLADMIDGTEVVPNFLAGPITSKIIAHMKEVREKVVHVLNSQPEVIKEAWSKDRDYDEMLSNLKIVMDKKQVEGTPLKRELMHWNEVILVAFGSLNENRPQDVLLLVLLHVYNDSHQYPKLPDYSLKMSRYIKLGEVWSVMFHIYTGLDYEQHRMLTCLRLACSFDDDIFGGEATLMGWTSYPPIGTQLRINVPALKSWKRADGNVFFITNELIKLDSAKQYLAAIANVRTLGHISR
jgi:hypothetical protein